MQKVGWFSSLRRQPKGGGSSAKLKPDKKLQKSCVDLTSSGQAAAAAEAALDGGDLVLDKIVNGDRGAKSWIRCRQCRRFYEPKSRASPETAIQSPALQLSPKGPRNLDEVINNAINCKIGAKYSQSGTTTVATSVTVDKSDEIRRLKDFATEYTEKIAVTRTTVVKRPVTRIEFFRVPEEHNGGGQRSELDQPEVVVTGTRDNKSAAAYNNRNGLVFDENGKVLTSLNFDFAYIDDDRPKSPPQPECDSGWVIVNSGGGGGGSSDSVCPMANGSSIIAQGSVNSSSLSSTKNMNNSNRTGTRAASPIVNLCDTCLSKSPKSRSDWSINSPAKVLSDWKGDANIKYIR